ncbi:conserved hypothetical protein [Candida tropicalis MYA-3404]|uniref:Uncharacterized protein n=1 Tax=Candida tropicalis (strain ATCC MYA-3404 / T1) TaxID=294747 RepID=C5M9E9_CANTT|nr:conserved hypothetical protein [Candida tropicalis MYA-3404]EER34203.1 conserved hypothetical protein [Candida tropicalis MYA-3404]KAG4408067.1 hypothetical protein JTP64_003603 [Candida tropicalis]MCP8720283.1 hypothetical protein [Asgard group archaeon]
MPTATGLLLSSVFGTTVRILQTSMSGSPAKLSSKLMGYGLTIGSSVGVYLLLIDPTLENNRKLFNKRLALLREQREKKAEFYDFQPAKKELPYKRGAVFGLLDRLGAKYQ